MIVRSNEVRAKARTVLPLLAAIGFALAATPALAGDTGLSGVVNVNTATLEQLTLLPGIGEARARALVAARKQRGGFKSVRDLLDVKGIGESGLAKLQPHVALQGKTTAEMVGKE